MFSAEPFPTCPGEFRLQIRRFWPRKKSHYEVLGVDSKASDTEIRAAFIRRSNELHPDGAAFRRSEKGGTEKFMELKEAYSVLRKPEQRREYDRELEFGRAAARDMFFQSVRPFSAPLCTFSPTRTTRIT